MSYQSEYSYNYDNTFASYDLLKSAKERAEESGKKEAQTPVSKPAFDLLNPLKKLFYRDYSYSADEMSGSSDAYSDTFTSAKSAESNCFEEQLQRVDAEKREKESAQRNNEITELKQNYETYQQASALQRAVQKYYNSGGKPQEESYVTEYGTKLEKLSGEISELSEKDYAETFEKLSGMSLDEYRKQKQENPDFKLKFQPTAAEQALRLNSSAKHDAGRELQAAHIDRRGDEIEYGKEEVKKASGDAVNKKEEENKLVKNSYQKERDKEGVITDALDFIPIGTKRADMEKTLGQEDSKVQEMKDAISNGDMDNFYATFRKNYGVDFSVQNFKNVKQAEQNLYAAAESKKSPEDISKLENEYKDSLRTAYGPNVSQETLDSYISTKETTYATAKGIAVFGAAALTGGTSLVANAGLAAGFAITAGAGAATSMAINTTEHSTDKDGLTLKEFGHDVGTAGVDGVSSATFIKGAPALGKVINPVIRKTGTSVGARCAQRVASAAIQDGVAGGASAFVDGTGKGLVDGKSIKESVNQGLSQVPTGAGAGTLFGLARGGVDALKIVRFNNTAKKMYDLAESVKPEADKISRGIGEQAGLDVGDSSVYSSRVKGKGNLESLKNKISREISTQTDGYLDHAMSLGEPEKAMSRIYDMYGARLNTASQEEIDKVFSEIVKSIEKGELKPTYVANYYGEGCKPVFSEEQMKQLKNLCDKMNISMEPSVFDSKLRTDGYTGLNFTAEIPSAKNIHMELQVRPKAIDKIANNVSHYPYDVFNGKDILSALPTEKKEILSPLVQQLKTIKSDSSLLSKYNKYMTECYRIARDNGTVFPRATEYGLSDMVSVENILKIDHLLHN